MKWFKRLLLTGVLLGIAIALVIYFLPRFNDYQTEGERVLAGLEKDVIVKRDEKGMAFIYARNLQDATMAQGFVTAQDRLFQMQLTRLLAHGRISELAGASARDLDIRMRTIGIGGIAQKQARILDEKTRAYFQSYVDGVNAFIQSCPEDVPLEFTLSGIHPEPWTVTDSLSILYYMAYSTSANLQTEITAQMLFEAVGPEKAVDLLPVNINPDSPGDMGETRISHADIPSLNIQGKRPSLQAFAQTLPLRMGSNNWVTGSDLSAGGRPILAGDPHLDARILPGVWYPVGIIAPEIRAVGATIPGLPGMAIGRTAHVAIAMTNNYGDMQDLYVETVDPASPDRYLEGSASKPFQVIEETLRIKDKKAPEGFREEKIRIRMTKRGPVVSDVFPDLKTDRVVTLRWAPAESMTSTIGLSSILTARSTQGIHEALKELPMLCLNWVFADKDGHIGYRASGRIPVRGPGQGTLPHVVKSSEDNWKGWIPQSLMPHADNPEKGWLGTCNHKTIPHDYPYYYSSYFSPSYRYRRLKELMADPGKRTVDDHWQHQRDVKNLMAEAVAPIMAKALQGHADTRKLGDILARWNFMDQPDLAAPTIFQATYIHFARLVFEDELGPETVMTLLNNWYFWEERLERMVLKGSSLWFDDQQTSDKVETLDDLFHKAGQMAHSQLTPVLGKDPEDWQWGKIHTLELVSPLRRKGPGKGLLGSGPMAMGGSGETLNRGWYDLDAPFGVTLSASLRMVADLSQDEKVAAVLPGGVTGRQFSPHQKDQVTAFMNGDKLYWWFSDRAIDAHTRSTLHLKPAGH